MDITGVRKCHLPKSLFLWEWYFREWCNLIVPNDGLIVSSCDRVFECCFGWGKIPSLGLLAFEWPPSSIHLASATLDILVKGMNIIFSTLQK